MASASMGLVFCISLYLLLLSTRIDCGKDKVKQEKAKKINKDVRDYSDVDVHHLLDQWNVSRKTFVF